jgi:nicotinamidase-related amidase
MERAYGLEIPRTLEEACDPRRLALLVYDMQAGVFDQAPGLRPVIPKVVEVLEAVRQAGVRTLFTRHTSLPMELMGVQQLRTALAWQQQERVAEVRSLFLPGSPGTQLIPEVAPRPSEAVFDKVGVRSRRELVGQIFLENTWPRQNPAQSRQGGAAAVSY